MSETFGVIVGNRGFFPDELARTGHEEINRVLSERGYGSVCLTAEDSKFGSVETRDDARKCAELFRKNADRISGVIVTLPNFGDERGVAETLRMSGLRVPVLIQASPDKPESSSIAQRRDSFCGKISVCSNLEQYGMPYSLTARHTLDLSSKEFAEELDRFAALCRVVNGLRNVRIGAIGARPAAFKTVRYSEKILELNGITIETIDLSEVLGNAKRLTDGDPEVVAKRDAIRGYVPTTGIGDDALVRMAKLGVVIDRFVAENDLNMTAIQCWTSLEENYGIVPCTLMGMMSNALIPSACEVDVCGALGMYAMQLASGSPSTILDWNNNYGDDPDKCVLFHCSNTPKHFMNTPRMDFQEIIAGSVGKENAWGTCVGRIKSGPMTYARFTTDDLSGHIRAYVGEGEFTDDPLITFGGYGVARIPNLQNLLQYICRAGFEHHVAVSMSSCADVLDEAFTTYLGFDTHHHA